ncbi:hypothetical protein AcW2_006831 [Taiwanofungus camphoratus]|nr:hypothetical protein AcW2_006831 [Antrodia cinnamomea]
MPALAFVHALRFSGSVDQPCFPPVLRIIRRACGLPASRRAPRDISCLRLGTLAPRTAFCTYFAVAARGASAAEGGRTPRSAAPGPAPALNRTIGIGGHLGI